jgi:PhnB protein
MGKDPKIPANYQTVMPYLIVKGAALFMNFMEKVFDATETHNTMRDEKIIRHAEIMVGESTIMLADATDQYPAQTAGFFIYVDNADVRYKKAIDAGAKAITPISDQPYGRTGGVADPFGNTWWITSIK